MDYNHQVNKGNFENRRKKNVGKKKKVKANQILVLSGLLMVLVLVLCMGVAFYMWLKENIAANAIDETIEIGTEPELEAGNLYTQEELDAKIQEAVKGAIAESSINGEASEVLQGIKESISNGDTILETLRPYYPNDILVARNGKIHFIPIQENLKKSTWKKENVNILESGEYQYLENNEVISYKGIDVSKHQGEIDWQQVAADGVEFAFIRVGFRGYGAAGTLVADEYFEDNIKGAIGAGIKVGVYFYSQAINEAEVLEEANFVLETIAPYKIDCPVVYDVEKTDDSAGRMNALSVEERTNLTLLFCQTIENSGYKPMIYYNMEMGATMLNLEPLEAYDKWFASYSKDMYYPYEYKVWQYTQNGKVAGISTDVDLNISLTPLWE